jgi:hypothetical protein
VKFYPDFTSETEKVIELYLSLFQIVCSLSYTKDPLHMPKVFSWLGAFLGAQLTGETFILVRENLANPLAWSLLIKPEVIQLTYRIRRYVLNGDANEAWRIKESYKDTFAMEAVAVSPLRPNL